MRKIFDCIEIAYEEYNDKNNNWYERITFFIFFLITIFMQVVLMCIIAGITIFIVFFILSNIVYFSLALFVLLVFTAYKTLVKREHMPNITVLYNKWKNK